MKTVILAGGFGSRLSEETATIPKPMVEIGDRPILWHIMNIYAAHGFTEFAVALGYKGEAIKEYFLDFFALNNDLSIDLATGKMSVVHRYRPGWKVHLMDTGLHTQTGGRILRLREWIGGERFMMTYGDGVGDVDIRKLVEFHRSHGKLATVTAVHPTARFGELRLRDERVDVYAEKPQMAQGWINGGFFVLEPQVLDYIKDDSVVFERGPLEQLAREGQLCAFRHEGFWQPMDTLREKKYLVELWESGKAPWKTWE